MSAREDRIRAALAGEKPDRIPYGFWTHYPGIDMDPDALAEATLDLCRSFGLDFVKNMPNGLFCIEDWDCGCDYSDIPRGGVARVTRLAVEKPADWAALGETDIEKGALSRELRSLERILAGTKGDVPVLATVFSPLTTAQKLAGPNLAAHMRSHPGEVKKGLATIAAVTGKFAARAVEMGCAGIYVATQMSQRNHATEAEYREFGVPFDLPLFEAVRGKSWFDVLHIHGDDIMFNLLKDYPARGISWHVWETAPTLEEFRAAAPDKCVVGGLRRFKITEGARGEIEKDIEETTRITGGRRLILAPGCVIRYPFDRETLLFLKNLVAKKENQR